MMEVGEASDKTWSSAEQASTPYTVQAKHWDGTGKTELERYISYGQDLYRLSVAMWDAWGEGGRGGEEGSAEESNQRMFRDACALIAYPHPPSSPLAPLLHTRHRETVCRALNSAILNSQCHPARPSLEVCAQHTHRLIKLMAKAGLGAAAFTDIDQLLSYSPAPHPSLSTPSSPPSPASPTSSEEGEEGRGSRKRQRSAPSSPSTSSATSGGGVGIEGGRLPPLEESGLRKYTHDFVIPALAGPSSVAPAAGVEPMTCDEEPPPHPPSPTSSTSSTLTPHE